MFILNTSTIQTSGQLYQYNNTISLDYGQYQSGICAHEYRMSQGLGQARAYKDDPEKISILGAVSEVSLFLPYGDCLQPYDPFTGLGDDFALLNGLGGDVKCSEKHPNLFVAEKHYQRNARNPNYLYVAALRVGERDFKLIGWTTSRELHAKADFMNPWARGWGYRLKMEYLKPFRRLIGEKVENS